MTSLLRSWSLLVLVAVGLFGFNHCGDNRLQRFQFTIGQRPDTRLVYLTPVASTKIAAPAYAEAELILECRKMYWDDVHPEHFLDPGIDANYPRKDYHRIYFGEILYMLGEEKFGKG